jgi:1-acyl-sn-glycerol-3-phosphate acyltransferase
MIHMMFKEKIRYLTEVDPNLASSCQSASRYDFSNACKHKLMLGAVFLLPIRLLSSVFVILIGVLLTFIHKVLLQVKPNDTTSSRAQLSNYLTTNISKSVTLMWTLLGIFFVKDTKVKIKDFIADYRPVKDVSKAPIAVSNHCGWFEIVFLYVRGYAFLMKKALINNPVLNLYSGPIHCLGVGRESEEDRERVKAEIQKRVDQFMSGEHLKPLVIFPEGTVGNGKELLTFKKGAFTHGTPIKIFALRYDTDQTKVYGSIGNIDSLLILLILYSQTFNRIEIIEFEDNFDPWWVYQKYKTNKDDPKAWEYVAQEIRQLIATAGGFRCTSGNYREIKDFYDKSLQYNQELVAASKTVS